MNRRVALLGVIDMAAVRMTRAGLLEFTQSEEVAPVELFINSRGGYTDASLEIIEIIPKTKCRIRAVAGGDCFGAAFWVFEHCHERVAAEDAKFGFGPPRYEREGPEAITGPPQNGYELYPEDLHYTKSLGYLSERSGRNWSLEDIRAFEGRILTAEECLKAGFIDRIIPPQAPKPKPSNGRRILRWPWLSRFKRNV